MRPDEPPEESRRWLVVPIAYLLVALVAFLVFREIQRPWEGPVGRTIYGEESSRDEAGEKWRGAFRVMATKGASAFKEMDTSAWRVVGLWTGGIVCAGGMFLLGVSAPFWRRWARLPPSDGDSSAPPVHRDRRAWLWLALALVVAGAIRAPYLSRSLLWDEQDNLRRNYHGTIRWDDPASAPIWQPAGADDAFWENRRGNNPHLHSLLAWTSNKAWARLTGAAPERYNIVAIRLPAFLGGLAGIAALWWCLRVVGLASIAGPAALLAAVHPLWTQYGIESRGYGLTLLFAPILMAAAWRFIQHAAWRDAALLSASSLLLLASYPGGLYFVVLLQATTFTLVLLRHRGPGRLAPATRWTIANATGGFFFLWVMAPILPQTAAVMENGFQRGSMPAYWFVMAHHLYATGMQLHFAPLVFFNESPEAPTALAWVTGDYWRMWPLAAWSLILFPVLVVAGLRRWWKNGHQDFCFLVLASFASGAACAGHHALVTGCFIYPWYMIFMLPGLLAACAAGIEALTKCFQASGKARPIAVVAVATFWVVTSYPAIANGLWKSRHAHCSARPGISPWPKAEEGAIPRLDFPRGSTSLWVNYRDGYQVHVANHTGREKDWEPLLRRPPEQEGTFTPPPEKEKP